MRTGTYVRALGWSAAGLALAALAGYSVVLLARDAEPVKAALGRGDDKTPAAAPVAAARVKTVHPTRERLRRETSQQASIDAYEQTDLYAKVSGYLGKFGQVAGPDGKMRDVDIGDRVAKDQVLAELWVPELVQAEAEKRAQAESAAADVAQAAAAVEAAQAMADAAQAKIKEASLMVARWEADVAYRKAEHQRYQRMLAERTTREDQVDEQLKQYRSAEAALASAKAGVSSAEAAARSEQAKVVKAKADVKSAEAKAKVAQASLDQAVIVLDYAKVRARFDGVVTRRRVDTGAFVQSAATGKAEPLFTLARTDRLRIRTEIPEGDAPWVKLGQPAVLRVDAVRGQAFAARVARFADALDLKTRTMQTELELEQPASALRPGMFGEVTITLADYPDALTLPTTALLPAGAKPAVMVVVEGKARRREVEVGSNDGARMHITRGLTAEDEVITDGKNTVRDGQDVTVAR
jgi:RND family efflux transporter MFP subunit